MSNHQGVNPFARKAQEGNTPGVANISLNHPVIPLGKPAADPFSNGVFNSMQGQSNGADLYKLGTQNFFPPSPGQLPSGVLPSGSVVGPFMQNLLTGGANTSMGAGVPGQMPGANPMFAGPQTGGVPISGSVMNCITQISSMMAGVMSQLSQFIQVLTTKMAQDKAEAAEKAAAEEAAAQKTEEKPAAGDSHGADSTDAEGTEGADAHEGAEGEDAEGADGDAETEDTGDGSFDKKVAKAGFTVLNGDAEDDITYKDSTDSEQSVDVMQTLDKDADGVISKDDLEEFKELAKGKKPAKDDPNYDEVQAAKALWKALGKKGGDAEKFVSGLTDNMEVLLASDMDDADDEQQYIGLTDSDISIISEKLEDDKSIGDIAEDNAKEIAESGDAEEEVKDAASLKTWITSQASDYAEEEDDEDVKALNSDVKKAIKNMFNDKYSRYANDGYYDKNELANYLKDSELGLDDPEAVRQELVANFDKLATYKSKGSDIEKATIDEKDAKAISKKFRGSDASLKKILGTANYADSAEERSKRISTAQQILTATYAGKGDGEKIADNDLKALGLEDVKTRYLIRVGLESQFGAESAFTVGDLKALKTKFDSGFTVEELRQQGVTKQKEYMEAVEYIKNEKGDNDTVSDSEWDNAIKKARDTDKKEGVAKAIEAMKAGAKNLTRLDGHTGSSDKNSLSIGELDNLKECFKRGYTIKDLIHTGEKNDKADDDGNSEGNLYGGLKGREVIGDLTK